MLKDLKHKIRFFLYRITEVKKTIWFTENEKAMLTCIGEYCLNDANFDAKSKAQINKLIGKTQRKTTKINFYDCQTLANLIYFEAANEGNVMFRDLVDKISKTPYTFNIFNVIVAKILR